MKSPTLYIEHLNITFASGSPDPMPGMGPGERRHVIERLPEVGESWPEQGGVFAGVMPAQDGHSAYALIVATDTTAELDEVTWGGRGEDEPGATSSWDGKANTQALLDSAIDHPAAEHCASLLIAGHNDWYLPARREASLMAATVPHLFKDGWHWTSTQYSAHNAFIQDFSDGDQHRGDKDRTWRVRAVRRFLIN